MQHQNIQSFAKNNKHMQYSIKVESHNSENVTFFNMTQRCLGDTRFILLLIHFQLWAAALCHQICRYFLLHLIF